MGNFTIFIAIAATLVLFRVPLHFFDKANILEAAREKGWTRVRVQWAPFAPGFFFENRERHYYVSYVDKDGKRGGRYCKTSLMTGVFWRDDDS
jgi:hypothetical protein